MKDIVRDDDCVGGLGVGDKVGGRVGQDILVLL